MSPTHEIVDQYLRPLWLQLSAQLSAREFVELLATCCSLTITFVVRRTNRWLREHSERERLRAEKTRLDDTQREFFRHKETVRIGYESLSIAQPLTFDELQSNSEVDWSIRSSVEPPAPGASSSTMRTKPRP
jgi:hypothetical protein